MLKIWEKEIIRAFGVILAIPCEGEFALFDFSSATSRIRVIFGVSCKLVEIDF